MEPEPLPSRAFPGLDPIETRAGLRTANGNRPARPRSKAVRGEMAGAASPQQREGSQNQRESGAGDEGDRPASPPQSRDAPPAAAPGPPVVPPDLRRCEPCPVVPWPMRTQDWLKR